MGMMRSILSLVTLGAILGVSCPAQQGRTLMTGMNVVNPLEFGIADQNAVFDQLKAAHVHVIRIGNADTDKGVDYARRAKTHGIKVILIVEPQYAATAPYVPYRPKEFPNMWAGHPLSYADPELSRAHFESLLGQLDAGNIQLAAIELGNEINWSAFNMEFPRPGKGRIFSYNDLLIDPEAQQVAKGYLQYLKVLAVLKEARDRSRVNRRTPILCAGLADLGPPRSTPDYRLDAITINATVQYLREHGLDNYVDGYAVHSYPSLLTPQARKAALLRDVLDVCGNGSPGQPKPCWFTEWGFDNENMACPLNDGARAVLVQETMTTLREAAMRGTLAAEIYFSWDSDAFDKHDSGLSVYRCGAPTQAAALALAP